MYWEAIYENQPRFSTNFRYKSQVLFPLSTLVTLRYIEATEKDEANNSYWMEFSDYFPEDIRCFINSDQSQQ